MVAQREPRRFSVDEWRKLVRSSHDIKHEYIDGQVYAMSGGSLAHGRIGLNVCTALENALLAKGKPCFVYNSDVATRLSSRRYTYPDASGPATSVISQHPIRQRCKLPA
jgi:Uma2 family endonuclease